MIACSNAQPSSRTYKAKVSIICRRWSSSGGTTWISGTFGVTTYRIWTTKCDQICLKMQLTMPTVQSIVDGYALPMENSLFS